MPLDGCEPPSSRQSLAVQANSGRVILQDAGSQDKNGMP
jgi:hypothetical protein